MSTTQSAALQQFNPAKTAVSSLSDLTKLGQIFAQSGFFADASKEAQAVVKVLAGAELGISPIAAMTGIYIVKGRISLGANLMAAKVKESKKYDYRVTELSGQRCEVEFFERRNDQFESIGKSEFTIEDARKAQTQNLEKFSRNMLFARAMSNGCKWFCPDIFTTPIYTPDELGAAVNEEGEVIDITPSRPISRVVEASPAMCDADTQSAIETLWPQFGRNERGEAEPLLDYLKRRKEINSLAELPQASAQALLEGLQKRKIQAEKAEAEKPKAASKYPCGDDLARQVIDAEARLVALGEPEAGIRSEWTAHAGTLHTIDTCDAPTAEAWLEILRGWKASLESRN